MVGGSTASNNWAGFSALGVDNQALYVTSNQFAFDGGFQYAKIRVIPKAGPYSGGSAPFFDFVRMKNPDTSMAFTIQPCHTFGAPQIEYLVNSKFPSGGRNRWGDYNGVAADPANPRLIWFYSDYATAVNTWATWVGSAFF